MVVEGGARVTVRRDLDKKKPAEGGPPMPVVTKENFSRLLTEIEQGTLAPIYLLFGESYLVGSALTQLTERLVPESQRGTNLQVVDGAQADFRAILDGLTTFPAFLLEAGPLTKQGLWTRPPGRSSRRSPMPAGLSTTWPLKPGGEFQPISGSRPLAWTGMSLTWSGLML
jgi:hypothetical protein